MEILSIFLDPEACKDFKTSLNDVLVTVFLDPAYCGSHIQEANLKIQLCDLNMYESWGKTFNTYESAHRHAYLQLEDNADMC